MPPRRFSSTAQRTTLAFEVSDSAGTIIVSSVAGFPSSRPYSLILDYETINEEIVEVTAQSGTTLTVTRGVDGTTGVAHDLGAVVVHGITGRDLGEPQIHMYDTDDVHGVTGDVVGTAGVQTLTQKSMDGVDNTFTNIPQSAIVGLTSDLGAKAPINNPTFTGTVVLPGTTSIGDVSSTELGYLNNATSNIQAQIDALDTTTEDLQDQIDVITNDTGSGTTLPIGGDSGDLLVKQSSASGDADWQTFFSLLPSLAGNAGKVLAVNADEDGLEWVTAQAGGGGISVIAVAPYPTGGTVSTYTDGDTGYEFRVHTFEYSGAIDQLDVENGVIGHLLVVGAGGAGGNAGYPTPNTGGGGGGAVYYQAYAFGGRNGGGNGLHNLEVGQGGQWDGVTDGDTTKFDDIWAYGGRGYGDGTPTYGSIDAGNTTSTSLFTANQAATNQNQAPQGSGTAVDITGSDVYYASGGAASATSNGSNGTDGVPYGGGGKGGSAGFPPGHGGDGADGVVIVRYRTA